MSFLLFFFEVIFISLSGVMAPGPMTAVTIGKGNESPHAGVLISIGHGIVEFPLMILIFFGFGYFFKLPYIKIIIAFVGSIFLLLMSLNMFLNIKRVNNSSNKYSHSPIIAGILLSIGNPLFLIWWATIGAALILRSVDFGIIGFIILALLHWSCDLLWLYFLSALSFKGGHFFGEIFQKIIFIICGVLLLFFSGKFIFNGIKMLL
ncbi:MAG: LysE family transporter [Spirochaetes bacterium]|nr:LysE family transporter [Spirochaetota bacterium]